MCPVQYSSTAPNECASCWEQLMTDKHRGHKAIPASGFDWRWLGWGWRQEMGKAASNVGLHLYTLYFGWVTIIVLKKPLCHQQGQGFSWNREDAFCPMRCEIAFRAWLYKYWFRKCFWPLAPQIVSSSQQVGERWQGRNWVVKNGGGGFHSNQPLVGGRFSEVIFSQDYHENWKTAKFLLRPLTVILESTPIPPCEKIAQPHTEGLACQM